MNRRRFWCVLFSPKSSRAYFRPSFSAKKHRWIEKSSGGGELGVVMVLFFFKLAELLPLLVRFLLTKIEQDLFETHLHGQKAPLDRGKQQRRCAIR